MVEEETCITMSRSSAGLYILIKTELISHMAARKFQFSGLKGAEISISIKTIQILKDQPHVFILKPF